MTEPTEDGFTFTGQMGVRSILFFTLVEGFALVGTTRLNFSGRAWGLAANMGEYFGGYIAPSDVVGDCTFEVHAVGIGPGMLASHLVTRLRAPRNVPGRWSNDWRHATEWRKRDLEFSRITYTGRPCVG